MDKVSAQSLPPDTEVLLGYFRAMLRIRRFEERVQQLFLEGEVPETLHQYQGQEAVAVGVCAGLETRDWITSTHRPHGHALAKGVSMTSIMAELLGRSDGCCGGKGGSMHLGDPTVGMVPAIAIVGGGLSIVTGLGLAFRIQRTGQIAVCFFGEGASNEGAFHEGLNFAAVKQLPILYVCENNLYGASTRFDRVSRVPDVAERAKAYGIRGEVVDGMDVVAVERAASRCIGDLRSGGGPVVLEAKTYRFVGHMRGDPRIYRSREEEAEWKARDPIDGLLKTLRGNGVAPDRLVTVEEEVVAEIEASVDFARNSALPSASAALDDVYLTDREVRSMSGGS